MKTKLNRMAISCQLRKNELLGKKGSGYMEMLIKILIAVVLGVLLLGLLTALINALWPQLTDRIFDLFGTGGTSSASST